MKKLLLLIPMLFLITGCWNYHELNELAITTGIAIDKDDDDLVVTVLISNSKSTGSDSDNKEPSTAVYTGKGKTFYDAIKDASSSISKQIYLSHIEILILSEDVLKDDISGTIGFILRYPQTRNNFEVVIARESKAGDVLKITTPLESFPSQNVAKNLTVTKKLQGYMYNVDFSEFVKDILEVGKSPLLPSVKIIGKVEEGNDQENIEKNAPATTLKLDTMGAFKENKFIAWTTYDESIGVNILNNKIDIFGIRSECEGGYTISEIDEMKTSIEVDSSKNKFKIKIKANGNIQENSCRINLLEEKNIQEITDKNIEKIKYYTNEAINFAKKYKTDIFGFGNVIYKKDFKYFNSIKDVWEDDLLEQISVEYEIDLRLESKGKINNYIEVK